MTVTEWQTGEPPKNCYIVVNLKERHWYDGPIVLKWDDDMQDYSLAEGWGYTIDQIKNWIALPD